MFTQGVAVIFDGLAVGTVAGLYDPIRYPNVYTIIAPKGYLNNLNERSVPYWYWGSHYGRAHPLNDLCEGKYVYNIHGDDLQLCKSKTKLGNEL